MGQDRTDRSMRTPALVVATLANFLTPFMGSSVNIALPAIGAEFAADAIVLSWIPTSFLLAAAMVAVPFGRIADIYGMKRIFSYGIALFTLASLLSALSPSALLLIVFRVFQGIAGGMIFVTGLAIITSVYPPHERGKAIGINIATVYVALSLGPVLGGIMTQYLGWRSLFFAMIPLGVIILAVTWWKLDSEWAASRGERFDLRGSVCLQHRPGHAHVRIFHSPQPSGNRPGRFRNHWICGVRDVRIAGWRAPCSMSGSFKTGPLPFPTWRP